ncbi:dolichyl-diphosphooligosaccharide--protein glycosyltransferase 48 kDa subunit [Phtheirospermum japonicum]|uniref:Dolichyl-diphosphooligosaccharide--protein glycosyltransferase 48 kDa subunit n=1 Tax=Phtheirospermum japonicum TaxID=374723 RepID=A0A830CNP9_9LAMI|nr:dolichyl-diphosphooligosaccharide--protein glycosyltransferase 48 kDa subunit [Phtheirospermum japonicum]
MFRSPVLVLLDDFAIKSSHSIFFKSLETRGFDLDFKLADDPKLALQRYGQYLYDAVICVLPNNRSIQQALVIDHTSYAVLETEGDHTLISSDDFIQSEVILGSKKIEAPVLFKGIGHTINSANNLVLKVLSASPAAYSANPKSKLSTPPTLTGTGVSLVSVVQVYQSSQFPPKLANACLGKKQCSYSDIWLTEHVQQPAVNVQHHKVGEKDEPSMYRIKDDLDYSVEVYEWSGKSWEPYVADDLQIQFYMMSPYVLKTMSTDQKGLYYTSFKVPDVYGVFQFKIPVRPFRHNEYERFIPAAYPYYGSSFSMMAGFFVFTMVYLYTK